MFFRNVFLCSMFSLSFISAGCSDTGNPSWVDQAQNDIATSINHDISGCKTKIYHKEQEWFVLCYAGENPAGGGALFEVVKGNDDNHGYDYYIIPLTGKAKAFANMSDFHIIHIPVRNVSDDYSSEIISKYFQSFD